MSRARIAVTDRGVLDSPALGVEIAAALRRLYPDVLQLNQTVNSIGSAELLQAIRSGTLTQLLILIFLVMKDHVCQLDFHGFALGLFMHVNCLEHPLAGLKPAVAKLFPVKTSLGFHGHTFLPETKRLLSLAYYGGDAIAAKRKETTQ
ncbi:MAG TPA: hypothetical protein VEP67_11465 [Thiobacillaceae bacterium]|nr:hypothetical protein [Thiobacillaceae bacterium]